MEVGVDIFGQSSSQQLAHGPTANEEFKQFSQMTQFREKQVNKLVLVSGNFLHWMHNNSNLSSFNLSNFISPTKAIFSIFSFLLGSSQVFSRVLKRQKIAPRTKMELEMNLK